MNLVSLSKSEKVKEFIALLKNPEVQAVLELFIDNALAKSELMVLKRISTLESKLGVSDMGLEDDELTIPEQLNLLASRIDNTVENYKPNLVPLQAAATNFHYTIYNSIISIYSILY